MTEGSTTRSAGGLLLAGGGLAAMAVVSTATLPGPWGAAGTGILLGTTLLAAVVGVFGRRERQRGGSGGWYATAVLVLLLVPLAVPLHTLGVVANVVADGPQPDVWNLLLGLYPLCVVAALPVTFVQGLAARYARQVLSGADPLSGSTDESGSPADRVVDRLADSRFWTERVVTNEQSAVDCDRCDRTDVPGVERTTIGGVAGQPLRETVEAVCSDCRAGDEPDGTAGDGISDDDTAGTREGAGSGADADPGADGE